MTWLTKTIIALLAILYGLPFIYIFCDSGPYYLLEHLFETIICLTGIYILIVFLLTILACSLVPVWIGIAWYFFVKRKNG